MPDVGPRRTAAGPWATTCPECRRGCTGCRRHLGTPQHPEVLPVGGQPVALNSTDALGAFSIHQALAAICDDEERFEAIKAPPLDERTGKRCWTPRISRQRVGYHGPGRRRRRRRSRRCTTWSPKKPLPPMWQRFLRRRFSVAFKVMTDDTARHQVNHAQVEQSRQPREAHEQQLIGAWGAVRADRARDQPRSAVPGPGRCLPAVRRGHGPDRALAARAAFLRG